MTKEFFEAKPISGELTMAHIASVATATQNALWSAIEKLAETKGTQDLGWFDALYEDAIKQAKGTVTEGIGIETEADALQFGVDAIDAVFKAYRQRLLNR